jgi:hypothetical protein
MRRAGTRSVLSWNLWGALLFPLAATVQAAPLVTSLAPNSAAAGDALEVKGTGLYETKEVLFVSGSAVKTARFKIVSDEQLEVTFPEFYRGTGSASVIVVGRDSVTVAMSDKMQTVDANLGSRLSAPFLQVIHDGSVSEERGIAVVGNGALVAKVYSSAVCFVQRNGTLAEFHGAILFYEPGAIFGDKIKSMRAPPKMRQVSEITISPNVEPVKIQSHAAREPFAKQPPWLTSITPAEATPGDVVVMKGKHLGHVTNVYFIETVSGGTIEAGFKAVNDTTLRVEVPQGAYHRQLVVVKNPAGVAVNISENPSPPPEFLDRVEARKEQLHAALFLVEYVRAGQIKKSGGGSRIFIIDRGGTLTSAGGGCCFLVRNGGRLVPRFGGGCTVIHEREALASFAADDPRLPAGMTIMTVGTINFSKRPLNLDIILPSARGSLARPGAQIGRGPGR